MNDMDRRMFLGTIAVGVGASSDSLAARPKVESKPRAQVSPSGLADPAFRPLRLGAIRPAGWLERQLRIQADDLSGHLDEFWPDVGQSQWFGGKAEGWERAPYWLDGVIPLAWLLDDVPLKKRIVGYIDYIITHQRADGWYGPYPLDALTKRYDMWAILLANKVLAQYHEATRDARVLNAVVKSLRAMQDGLQKTPLYGWGKFRWQEGLVSIFHAYEHTGEPWLLDLARTLRVQGVDSRRCSRPKTSQSRRRGAWKWTKHVVNTAMAEGVGAELASRSQGSRPRVRATHDRHPRSPAWDGDRDVHRRRVPGRPQSPARHRIVRRRRIHVLARAPLLGVRRSVLRGSARARRVQRAAGGVRARHVVAPVRPAGQPGAVHDQRGSRGRKIPSWKIVNGWAGELAPKDIASADPGRPVTDQPMETIMLIPYGCTNIRITEFPKL